MTQFQSTVASQQGFGVPGEIMFDRPWAAESGIIDSAGPNTVGFAFTQVAAADGHAAVGGAVADGTPFYGILANPKVYPLIGTGSGTLAPTLNMPQYAQGEFVTMGDVLVALTGPASIGDIVDYVQATGAIVTRPPKINCTATWNNGTQVLTVSAMAAGSALIYPGAKLLGPTGTVEVLSQATGPTGGAGTYNCDSVAATEGAGSPYAGASVPYTGNVNIPRATIQRYGVANNAGGPAIVRIAA